MDGTVQNIYNQPRVKVTYNVYDGSHLYGGGTLQKIWKITTNKRNDVSLNFYNDIYTSTTDNGILNVTLNFLKTDENL